MNKSKVFLTGASGFIGKNILKQLGSSYVFYSPSHQELDLLNKKDVDDFFNNHQVDVVIHCAVVGGSQNSEKVKDSLDKNLKMFKNIIDNQDSFKKMVFMGSGAEYDKSHSIVQVKEIDFGKNVPKDNYGKFKYLASRQIEKMNKVINLRLFGLFGECENYSLRFISNAVCKNLYKLPIDIKQNVFFDYVWINDFIKILNFFIKNKPKYKFYNIGQGKKMDLITIAKKINNISPHNSKIIIKNPGLNNEYTCDNSRLLKEMGDFNFTNFDESLVILYNWYKKNLSKIRKENLI